MAKYMRAFSVQFAPFCNVALLKKIAKMYKKYL